MAVEVKEYPETNMFAEMREAGSTLPDMVEYLQANGWESYKHHDNWVMKEWSPEVKDTSLFDTLTAYVFAKYKQGKVYDAVNIIISELAKDKSPGSYYHSWQCNIAMSFYDAFIGDKTLVTDHETIHRIANDGAKRFLDLLIYTQK